MDIFSTTTVSSLLGGATSSENASTVSTIMRSQAKRQLNQKLTAVGDSYSGRFRDMGNQLTAINRIQEGTAAAVSSLKGAKSSIDALGDLLGKLAEIVRTANDPAKIEYAVAQFQAQMTTMHAMTSPEKDNLLSGPEQRLAYVVDEAGTEIVFKGNNMGSSYTIAASDGKVWAPSETGSSLVAYTSYPNTTAGASSGFYGGTRLNSLSGSTIDFTVGLSGSTPQNLTGTLSTKGLGVMDSWVYDDLSTQAGRDRAVKALTDAQSAVKVEGYRYDTEITTAEYYHNRSEMQANVLTNQQMALTEEQALKAADLQDKFDQSQAALAMAMQGVALAGVQLASVLPETNSVFSSSTTSQPLFDIFA